MNSLSGLGRHFGLPGSLSIAFGLAWFVDTAAVAADEGTLVMTQITSSTRVPPVKSAAARTTIGPQDNNVVGSAHMLVPDGSSVNGNFAGADDVKWYATEVEPGKSYVIEALDLYGDRNAGSVGRIELHASDGVGPPPESSTICGVRDTAPGLGASGILNGDRCIFRTFYPAPGNTQDKRDIFIGVFLDTFSFYYSFHIRVRETTIYGRWTTNGYDFHVELQNTSATDMCAWVEAYPNSGTVYNGAAPHLNIVNIPAYGANKIVIPNGTLVGTDNRGTLRINTCPNFLSEAPTFTTGALHVSTYAFNPVTKQYLYFFPWTANNGNNGNSF